MLQLKGLDLEIASRRYEIARRDEKMILNVKLLVRELTPYGGQKGSSRDRKELPFPRANELPSFPRGRILHRARLDGRRAGGGKMENLGERLEALRSCLLGLLAHISYPDYASFILFTFSFMFSCLAQRSPYIELFSRCLIRLFCRLRKAILSGIYDNVWQRYALFIINFLQISFYCYIHHTRDYRNKQIPTYILPF